MISLSDVDLRTYFSADFSQTLNCMTKILWLKFSIFFQDSVIASDYFGFLVFINNLEKIENFSHNSQEVKHLKSNQQKSECQRNFFLAANTIYDNKKHGEKHNPAPIHSCLNVVVWSLTPYGLGRNGCWTYRGSKLPRALPLVFRYATPRTTAEDHHTASIKSVACFLFSPALFFHVFVSLFFFFFWWAVTFIPTLGPSFPALFALEMWPGEASQCNAAPAPNGSIYGAHNFSSPNLELLTALTPGAAPLLCPHS